MKPEWGRRGQVLHAPEREGDDGETVAEQARERKITVEQACANALDLWTVTWMSEVSSTAVRKLSRIFLRLWLTRPLRAAANPGCFERPQ